MEYVKRRRAARWNNGGICKTQTKSAAQIVRIVEDYQETRMDRIAYEANMKHNWPNTYRYTYDVAMLTGDWSEYQDEG